MMLKSLKGMARRFHPLKSAEVVSLIELFEDPINKFEAFKILVDALENITSYEEKKELLASLPKCNYAEAGEILS
jgi:hypothetical protein